MKYLKIWESFKEENILILCSRYGIKNYTINSDGSIDVDESVNLNHKRLTKLHLNFNHITNSFTCYGNLLVSLEGCPKSVNGNFSCGDNRLKSLKGCPEYVGAEFCCSWNQLKSLEGTPQEISNDFRCSYNKLTSLQGAPRKIKGNFNCAHNIIWSLEGAPDYIDGTFYCDANPIYNIWKLFKDYSKVELFNYYDIIREIDGKPAIVLDRLNDFLEEIGKEPVEKVDEYINI